MESGVLLARVPALSHVGQVFVFLPTGNIAVVRRFQRLLTVVEDEVQPEQPPGACRPPWSPSPPVQPPVRPLVRCTTSSCCGKSVSFPHNQWIPGNLNSSERSKEISVKIETHWAAPG
ncbi:unnamed protein product [Arctogadus glacialis]